MSEDNPVDMRLMMMVLQNIQQGLSDLRKDMSEGFARLHDDMNAMRERTDSIGSMALARQIESTSFGKRLAEVERQQERIRRRLDLID